MSYDGQKVKIGREPVYIIELELTSCANTFSISPCTASGAAGTECFNTFGTCQDKPNFTTTTKKYRFSSTRLDLSQSDGDAPTFPTIKSVSTNPAILTPSNGLGVRSTLSVVLNDHPWTDIGIDPYLSNRSYDADLQGTFWGKLISRNQYYEGRKIIVKTGYLEDDGTYNSSNFISRAYFIDHITGPDKNEIVKITAKDILKFADTERAQLPAQSSATLNSDITNSQTSFYINDPSYIIETQVTAGQRYIRIDEEIMYVNSVIVYGSNSLLSVTRASQPSIYSTAIDIDDHKNKATVQNCYFFDDLEIDNIIYYLLNTVAGIDSSYLPTTSWQDVIDFGLINYKFSSLISEPTGVDDLLKEITQHTILLWWDDRNQLVQMDSLLSNKSILGPYGEDENLVADSISVARDDGARVSQVWLAYGHRSSVLALDESKNFSNVSIAADLDLETTEAYGRSKIEKIFSRWLPSDIDSVASEITFRTLGYYKDTKSIISFSMDAKDDVVLTGDMVKVITKSIQDQFGASKEEVYRVLQTKEILSNGNARYTYTAQPSGRLSFARFGLVSPEASADTYTNASDSDKLKYCFVCYDTELFLDNTGAYRII